jgi:hypothetical protein
MLSLITSRTKASHAFAIAGCLIALSLGALASTGTAQARVIGSRHAPAAAAPLDYQGCAAGFFCTADYEVTAPGTYQWTLQNYILHGGTYFLPYGECSPNEEPGCDVGIVSFANNTGYRVWLEQFQNRGNEYCISNHTDSNTFNDNVNYDDYWIYFSDNPAAC